MYFFLQLITAYCKCWPWNPNSLDLVGGGWVHPPAHPTALAFPSKLGRRPCSQQDGEGFLCPLEPPYFLLLFSGLPTRHNEDARYQHSEGHKWRFLSNSGHRLHRLWLKRGKMRFQAVLSNHNGQISFLNILRDLDCSSQRGNKKYSFCNPALLQLLETPYLARRLNPAKLSVCTKLLATFWPLLL